MPAIYEDVTAKRFVGMTCDVCGMTDPNGCNDFVLRHTFGFGSPRDGDMVEAAICDNCLEGILRGVPGAQWDVCPNPCERGIGT